MHAPTIDQPLAARQAVAEGPLGAAPDSGPSMGGGGGGGRSDEDALQARLDNLRRD